MQIEFPTPEIVALDHNTEASLEKLLGPDKSRLIVFYCGFVKCTRSHKRGDVGSQARLPEVYRHRCGIKAGDEAGYPMEKMK